MELRWYNLKLGSEGNGTKSKFVVFAKELKLTSNHVLIPKTKGEKIGILKATIEKLNFVAKDFHKSLPTRLVLSSFFRCWFLKKIEQPIESRNWLWKPMSHIAADFAFNERKREKNYEWHIVPKLIDRECSFQQFNRERLLQSRDMHGKCCETFIVTCGYTAFVKHSSPLLFQEPLLEKEEQVPSGTLCIHSEIKNLAWTMLLSRSTQYADAFVTFQDWLMTISFPLSKRI